MNLHKRLLSLILCIAMTLAFVAPVNADEAIVVDAPVVAEAVVEETAEEVAVETETEAEEEQVAEEASDEEESVDAVEEVETETAEEVEGPETVETEETEEEPAAEVEAEPAPAAEAPIERGELSVEKISLDVGESAKIVLQGAVADEFESGSDEVATVTDDGKVVAVSAGTTKIIVTDENDQVYTCVVDVDGVLSSDSVTIAEKKTANITLTGAEIASVKSSNTSVATITTAGKITAAKTGKATITVTDTVGNKYTCDVNVTTSYLNRVASNAKYVYGLIASLHCRHGIGTTSLSQLKSKKKVTCNSSASIALQLSGILPTGKTMGHTAAKGGNEVKKKNTVSKAIKKKNLLKSGTYTIVRAGKKYSSLPAKYKQAGMVYIQDSNMCISAGGGYMYSCNQSSKQMKGGKYYKTKVNSGYPFTHPILYIIVPKG